MFLCFKLAPIGCSALIHSTLLSSWLLEQLLNIKTHKLFIYSTEKISRILNHKMVQGADLIILLWNRVILSLKKKWISSFTLNLLTGSQLAINSVLKKEKSIFGLEYICNNCWSGCEVLSFVVRNQFFLTFPADF